MFKVVRQLFDHSSQRRTTRFRNMQDYKSFRKLIFMWVSVRFKSSGGSRPKRKLYHRDHELGRVMDLQKKSSFILQLKTIIQSPKYQSILVRDLEKEARFVKKWNIMAAIEKYPSKFYVGWGNRTPPFVRLTKKAEKIAGEEVRATELMEPF